MSIAIIYWTQLTEIHKYFFFILRTLLFIFLTFARLRLQHLLENHRPLYSLHCSLLTPHILIVHQIHVQDQSLSYRPKTYKNFFRKKKMCRKTQALTTSTANSGLTFGGCWKSSAFITQNSESTFHIPSCSAQVTVVRTYTLFFLTLRLDPPKARSIFLFSTNPSSPTEKHGTFGPYVPERGLSLGNSSIFVWIDIHSADPLKIVESVFSVHYHCQRTQNSGWCLPRPLKPRGKRSL